MSVKNPKINIPSPVGICCWLIENTSLTFNQISDFCNIDEFQINAIADGDIYNDISPIDPIAIGILNQDIINQCQEDEEMPLEVQNMELFQMANKKQKKHTSTTDKREKNNAILWLLTFYPTLKDSQIAKLTRSTSGTVKDIRNKTHKNFKNLIPKSAITLEFCTNKQIEDFLVKSN